MTGRATELVVPREQFLSWKFFALFPRNRDGSSASSRDRLSFFWARNAIYHALKCLNVSPGAHVLLPAYLCRAAVEPFEFYGTIVDFYSIDRNCRPNLQEIETKIMPDTQAILVAHYFGFPQEVEKIREICDRHNVALIEDCAHVLSGSLRGRELGSYGDAAVFSWRKFLPIYDGGELRLKGCASPPHPDWQKESALFSLKVAKSLFDSAMENSTGTFAKSLARTIEFLKSAIKKLRRRSGDAYLFELDSNRATFDASLLRQRMSRVSRWLFAHCDLPAIIEKRRQNFGFLLERIRSVPGITPLHDALPDSVCPWIFPVFCDGIPDAHLRLQREGVPAVNWAGVRPPALDSGAFPDADFLYDHLVFLPVHQNINSDGLEHIARALQKISAPSAKQSRSFDFAASSKIA